MRRLVIDEIIKLAMQMYRDGDVPGFKGQVTLLQNILCSITSTIKPGEVSHPGKITELHHIRACLLQLKQLA